MCSCVNCEDSEDHGRREWSRSVKFHEKTLTGAAEARAFRPQDNFLANCQQRRLQTNDADADDRDQSWTKSFYQFAKSIAENVGNAQIVDLSTGNGRQFEQCFFSGPWKTFQVDYRDRRHVRNAMPPRPFLQVNLELYDDLERLEAAIDNSLPTLFILSDVVGRLSDLRPLFRTLRRLLKRHPANRLVVSTPGRDQFDEREPGRLPENLVYVREWSLNEFGLAMRSAGFDVRRIGWLTDAEGDHAQGVVCCELSCTHASYAEWLEEQNLPQPETDHLILTTEHGDAERSGGIGAYVKRCEALHTKALTFYVGKTGLPAGAWLQFCRERGWLHVFDLTNRVEHLVDDFALKQADIVLNATLQAVFIFDQIRLIEYQDYGGLGYRIAQAKRVGLLPHSITVLAVAHGDHFYLDCAQDSIDTGLPPHIAASEKLSVELADGVIFPTQYIRNLYKDYAGYRVRADQCLPLPVSISPEGISDLERRSIETLVFFGKQTRQKGYDGFVAAVLSLMKVSATRAATQLKRIVLLGVDECDPKILELPVQVEFGSRSHAEAKAMLRELAADSLIVLPYRGDNHPLSFFEVVEADCQVLAYRAGGLPELVPPEVSEFTLCNANPDSLARGIEKALSLTHADRCELIRTTRKRVRETYVEHTANFGRAISRFKESRQRTHEPAPTGAVTVIVPNLNGETRLIEDVATGLINSLRCPEQVLIVDDCSDKAGREALHAALPGFGDLSVEVIQNQINLGLAGARNVGLRSTTTPYICAHDNDNVILHNFLELACRALDQNPDVAAVTSFTRFFQDGDPWQIETWCEGYRPIGADFGIALRMNCLGDALAVYRASDLRDVGGWNETSRAKWEDWELFLKLIAHGKDVWVIPEEQVLYRERPNSMLRTYPDISGWLRLSEAFVNVPKRHAVSALRAVWTPSQPTEKGLRPLLPIVDDLRAINSKLQAEFLDLRAVNSKLRADLRHAKKQLQAARKQSRQIENSMTWRASSGVREILSSNPYLKNWFQRTLRLSMRVRKRLIGKS